MKTTHKRNINLAGQSCYRLFILHRVDEDNWLCRCNCGVIKEIKEKYLVAKSIKSCGCMLAETRERWKTINKGHGRSRTKEYNSWRGMVERCTNENHIQYHSYGGRGIKIYESWLKFENFYKDMGDCNGLSLDRINNDGNYEPGNCRWATTKEQHSNKSNSRKLTYNGITKCVFEWAAELGFHAKTIADRIDKHSWSVEKALTTLTPRLRKQKMNNVKPS